MRRSVVISGAILFSLALAAPAPANAEQSPLTEAQLKALFAGGLEFAVDALRTQIHFKYKPNGKWIAEQPGGQEAWGQWKIDGDKLCRETRGPPDDPQRVFDPWYEFNLLSPCFPVLRDGNRIIMGDVGKEVRLYTPGALARISPPPAAPPKKPAVQPAPAPKAVAQDDEALRLEKERLALEREKLAEAKAENDRKLEAEKRDLEMMRIELERQRLQRERDALQRMRSVPKGTAVADKDIDPPFIDAPVMLETKADSVEIDGTALDNGRLTRVELNGADVPFNARDGKFSVRTKVPVGRSKLSIAAYDSEGNKAEHFVTVVRSRDIPPLDYGKYHALVIGIDDYKDLPKLHTAVADARSVAQLLKDNYGYDVHLLENATRTEIIDALDDLREQLNEDDNLLIYYAGHGWRDDQNGRGYWLPVGAEPDHRSNWFSNASLTDALQAMLARHVLVVADSCYSGTLTRSARITARSPDYIARMAEKRARVVLSSGGLEPVADSGGGKHSIFAQQFLSALRENEGVLDGTQLFEEVRNKVVLNANQTPEYSDIRFAGHEGGDFLFVRKE